MDLIMPRFQEWIQEWILDRKYRKFYQKCDSLHIPVPKLILTRELFDKNGKRVWKKRRYSHSWCRNGYNWAYVSLIFKNMDDSTWGAGLLSMKDTGGNVYYNSSYALWWVESSNPDSPNTTFGALAPAGIDTHGILVGTGTDAESFEDYALAAQIANGTGSGEMSYVESEAHDVSYGSLTFSCDFVRYFNNNSGGSITVNEIAYVAKLEKARPTPTYSPFLLARDKLSSGDVVADTAQYKVTYTIDLTYPA